jgi:hypothetical protein
MDEKISLEAIALYGDAYSEKLMKGYFSSHEKISGKDILSLSSVHQVNLFVIRELFKAWKEETRKQKSAYFNYENEEVKEALNNFMSVLSNHISIDKAYFSPLLKKAVSQTLLSVFDPYDFFSMLITGKNNRLEVTSFREEIKYLKINKAPLERMLQILDEKKITEIQGNEAFAILDQILEEVNFTPEDLDDYVNKFSEVVPLDPNGFYVTRVAEPVFNNTPRNEVRENVSPGIQEKKIIKENRPSEATVNDQGNSTRPQAVMDNFRKIAKIKESLTINQKFMFTKVLFYGDFESFSKAIDELDQLPDMKSAINYLEKRSQSWDRESKEFHEFMEMVEKRFG